MVFSNNSNGRSGPEKLLFYSIITPWKKLVNIFKNNININKIDSKASSEGFMWFNFWWARGSYLKNCE